MSLLLPSFGPNTKVMIFVDGENFAIRYGSMLGDGNPAFHVAFERNLYVWSSYLNLQGWSCDVVRKYYYTSLQGDDDSLVRVQDVLRENRIEAPRVFKKTKGKRSKRVDISLATDMLTHAHRKNYDIALLIAGDEDYVPLVEAVIAEGRRVVLWFVEDGLSPALRRSVDHYYDIGQILFERDRQDLWSRTTP